MFKGMHFLLAVQTPRRADMLKFSLGVLLFPLFSYLCDMQCGCEKKFKF